MGLELTDRGIVTWAEIKSLMLNQQSHPDTPEKENLLKNVPPCLTNGYPTETQMLEFLKSSLLYVQINDRLKFNFGDWSFYAPWNFLKRNFLIF